MQSTSLQVPDSQVVVRPRSNSDVSDIDVQKADAMSPRSKQTLIAHAGHIKLKEEDIEFISRKDVAVKLSATGEKEAEKALEHAVAGILGNLLLKDKKILDVLNKVHAAADPKKDVTDDKMEAATKAIVDKTVDSITGKLQEVFEKNPDLQAKVPNMISTALINNKEVINGLLESHINTVADEGTFTPEEKEKAKATIERLLLTANAPQASFLANILTWVIDPASSKKGQATKAFVASAVAYWTSGWIGMPVEAAAKKLLPEAMKVANEATGNRTVAMALSLMAFMVVLIYQCSFNCTGGKEKVA